MTDQPPNTGSIISPAEKAEDIKKHECQRCGQKGHLEKSCWAPLLVDPANQPHQVGKGKGGGKGQEDKGKGKGKQLERSPPPPTIPPGTEGNHKCPWHQTPCNNRQNCTFGDRCKFKHEMCQSQQEFDSMARPLSFKWRPRSRSVSLERPSSQSPKGALEIR